MKVKAILLAAALMAAALFSGCSSQPAAQNSAASGTSKTSVAASSEESTASQTSTKESTSESSAEVSQESEAVSSQPTGQPVDTSWFNDALFIGDSVTLKLSYYSDTGAVGDAMFLCAGSLGYNNCLWDIDREDNVHPVYEGVKYTIFDGAKMLAPKKILIMLGMNDIGLYGVDGAAEAMQEVLDKLKESCPEATIYVESVTPMLENMQLTDLNNTTIPQFNEKAKAIAEEKGCIWLNVASAMEDGSGNLVYDYCGDPDAMGLHFSDTGCAVWVDYLKNHVQ
ncbi:MAG: GDSL-type esterase/lipase family protein [Acutalibacteraceae bacterium]|nr:GDSL-type esterase/lipase family protein [Acutalibacteraceae bacterium]